MRGPHPKTKHPAWESRAITLIRVRLTPDMDSLHSPFSEFAEEVGDGPVDTSELGKLEAKYRTALSLALERAVTGAPYEEQKRRLPDLIQHLWLEAKQESGLTGKRFFALM